MLARAQRLHSKASHRSTHYDAFTSRVIIHMTFIDSWSRRKYRAIKRLAAIGASNKLRKCADIKWIFVQRIAQISRVGTASRYVLRRIQYIREIRREKPEYLFTFRVLKIDTQSGRKLSLHSAIVTARRCSYTCMAEKYRKLLMWSMHSVKIAEIQGKARDSPLKMSHTSYIFLRRATSV